MGFGASSPYLGAAKGEPTLGYGKGPLGPAFDSPSDFWMLPGKIESSVFMMSNSENISRTTFLKPKTAENRELALGILSIG